MLESRNILKLRLKAAVVAAALGCTTVFAALTALPASAHGWVTDPPSRQANCANGATSFDCGAISYEPQSVEAPKGSLQCSGGNTAFAILNDDSKPWPVKNIGSTVTIKWNLTALHATSVWEYFVDGTLHQSFNAGGAQPTATTTHTLTNLPAGKHKILARWNVSNTTNAFYNCMDVNVTTGGSNPDPTPTATSTPTPTATPSPTTTPTPTPTATSGTNCPAAYDPAGVYVAGDQVLYNGNVWETKWWTQGQAPGTTGQWGQWVDLGPCAIDPTPTPTETTSPTPTPTPTETASPTPTPTTSAPTTPGEGASNERVVGYFANWGVYDRNYHVKNIKTSGSADKLTHILYAFGNVQNGKCTIGDAFADYEKSYTAAQSVDGVADVWDQPLRGNFNQLRKLKAEYPDLKVIWSFGGWTWSSGFGAASQNAAAFAKSCHDLVEDPRWADVFDGIDIDWEYPNACGLTCDTSGYNSYRILLQALRAEFGTDLVTSAIGADATSGGKIDAADYAGGAQYLDFIMPMTYDYFGAWNKTGPTAAHSPLTSYAGIPTQGNDSATTIAKLKGLGIPSDKILLGVGFYGRGWTGVTQSAPGGTATGAANGTYEAGIEDYKVLKNSCPTTGTIGGTAYAFCNGNWWSYDTPATISTKMDYAQAQDLGGAFFWELSGDTTNGELINALHTGLQ